MAHCDAVGAGAIHPIRFDWPHRSNGMWRSGSALGRTIMPHLHARVFGATAAVGSLVLLMLIAENDGSEPI
ncbi:hypothetical protein RKLH11_4024 [Rhodobacteraceae bacterium KLH11]|nr:hypothetical protein RKLH11_4024 [Rhodobacteraceae bacterium KLH11]